MAEITIQVPNGKSCEVPLFNCPGNPGNNPAASKCRIFQTERSWNPNKNGWNKCPACLKAIAGGKQ